MLVFFLSIKSLPLCISFCPPSQVPSVGVYFCCVHTCMFSCTSDKCLTVNVINHPAAAKGIQGEKQEIKKERMTEKEIFFTTSLFHNLIHSNKSLSRRPRQGLISQTSKIQPWEAENQSVVPICLLLECFIFRKTSLVLALGRM